MRAQEVKGLIEAYSRVYVEPQELTKDQVWEEVETWVNSLVEEGYDLSEYTWEEMYESYLTEGPFSEYNKRKEAEARASNKGPNPVVALGTRMFGSGKDIAALDAKEKETRVKVKQAGAAASGKYYSSSDGKYYANKNDALAARNSRLSRLRSGSSGGGSRPDGGSSTSTAKPTAPAKPASTQTGDKAKDTATWAKANPKLAAAAAEKARIRGTSQSDNPLMKGMPGKRPMTPSVQSPTLAKDLGKGSGNQSLLNNPNASKAAPPKPATTPASTSAAKPATPATSAATSAAKPSTSSSPSSTAAAKPSAPSLQQSIRNRRLNMNMDIDLFDLVKGYLLGEGYAETEESAIVMMVNMSEGWRESILEVIGGQSGDGYIGHPKLGIKNPMSPPKKGVTSAPKNTGLAGRLGNRAAQMDAAMKQLNQSHEIEGEQLDESRNEELELWVEELIAEGYDLSGYTWEEVAEIYAQELELIEAQSARENPEDHDKEDKKKYEKVRGEKTPMPPRGDKRREDFEKWYAANVR